MPALALAIGSSEMSSLALVLCRRFLEMPGARTATVASAKVKPLTIKRLYVSNSIVKVLSRRRDGVLDSPQITARWCWMMVIGILVRPMLTLIGID
jgi:hypothetical protein